MLHFFRRNHSENNNSFSNSDNATPSTLGVAPVDGIHAVYSASDSRAQIGTASSAPSRLEALLSQQPPEATFTSDYETSVGSISGISTSLSTVPVPPHVTQAIRNYVPPKGFSLLPKRRGERSIILDWGVRVGAVLDGKDYVCWICQGSIECRPDNKLIQLFGNTSKATKHLSEKHLVTAGKIVTENSCKRSRAERLERIRNAIESSDDSRRMTLLLETLRIVNNILPFRIGEYDESEMLADLIVQEEFRATINSHTVTRAIIELYSSARSVICSHLERSRIREAVSFAMVCDFWTSKTQKSTKYLGMRVYFIDSDWKFQSIFLGTRHFEPTYGERSGGERKAFRRWITELLRDFELTTDDFFGATSDSGPDVKFMMTKELKLQWEWCVPHLPNAAAKVAFGIVPQLRSNATMGSIFAELCEMANQGSSNQLLEHKDHRFVGLERVVRRLLEKWEQLEDWFEERINKAIRERKPAPESLPIADDKQTLLQLYGLLQPIALLNTKSQKEGANQVEVLLYLFRLRVTVLDETQPLKDRMQPHTETPIYFQISDLTQLTRKTRALLVLQFHKNFFSRYTDRSRIRETAYIPEIQMMSHPGFKNPDRNLKKVVRICNEQLVIDPQQPHLRLDESAVQRNIQAVKDAVLKRLRHIMMAISTGSQNTTLNTTQVTRPTHPASEGDPLAEILEFPNVPPAQVFSEEIMELFGEDNEPVEQRGLHESRIDEEIEGWLADPCRLTTTSSQTESILEFWKRQQESHNYRLLPIAASIIYAIPASSAQIERDFGISGMLVTSHRTSLAKHNIDMCSFINRNRHFIDIADCKKTHGVGTRDRCPSKCAGTTAFGPHTNAICCRMGTRDGFMSV